MKSGHHCCPCQAPPPPVLVTTSPNARIIRQSSQPEASACCCSGCCCPLHTGAAPSAASLRQLREPGDGIAGIAADSLRINGGIRQFRQVSRDLTVLPSPEFVAQPAAHDARIPHTSPFEIERWCQISSLFSSKIKKKKKQETNYFYIRSYFCRGKSSE